MYFSIVRIGRTTCSAVLDPLPVPITVRYAVRYVPIRSTYSMLSRAAPGIRRNISRRQPDVLVLYLVLTTQYRQGTKGSLGMQGVARSPVLERVRTT